MRPKGGGSENGITSMRKISKRFVHGVGFSNGCAELTLKKPPPLVPSSLIASWDATGPPGIDWAAPVRVVASVNPVRFCTTPPASSTTAAMTANGSSRRNVPRTRSTQKLPITPLRRYAKPRTRATATAMPTTAAETKFCTVSAANCTV